MASDTGSVRLTGLAKQQVARLARRASRLGMTPEGYLRHLVEEDLAISREATTTTFQGLVGSGREVDEQKIDRLVETAKSRHHRHIPRKR
ncbi:MAG: hypothetical protein IT440_00980 [Phycisphaeraceae bacterium]|nr:hypothetical protein [Phycisphaeraceae bacterium]